MKRFGDYWLPVVNLTVVAAQLDNITWTFSVRIPNKELYSVFNTSIQRWFQNAQLPQQTAVLNYLIQGDIESFTTLLSRFLLHSLSYFDVSIHQTEQVYHAFYLRFISGCC